MNHRSGGDRWYSAVIDSCRRGCLDLDDWRFLHGASTTCCGSWLTASKTSICGDEKCADFSRATAKVRDLSAKEWQQRVGERNAPFECVVCQEHRRQRCRVYQPLSEDYLVLQCIWERHFVVLGSEPLSISLGARSLLRRMRCKEQCILQ